MVQTKPLIDRTEPKMSKRTNPNFTKITADIHLDIATKVRVIATLKKMTVSEVVETALSKWIEENKDSVKFEI